MIKFIKIKRKRFEQHIARYGTKGVFKKGNYILEFVIKKRWWKWVLLLVLGIPALILTGIAYVMYGALWIISWILGPICDLWEDTQRQVGKRIRW